MLTACAALRTLNTAWTRLDTNELSVALHFSVEFFFFVSRSLVVRILNGPLDDYRSQCIRRPLFSIRSFAVLSPFILSLPNGAVLALTWRFY